MRYNKELVEAGFHYLPEEKERNNRFLSVASFISALFMVTVFVTYVVLDDTPLDREDNSIGIALLGFTMFVGLPVSIILQKKFMQSVKMGNTILIAATLTLVLAPVVLFVKYVSITSGYSVPGWQGWGVVVLMMVSASLCLGMLYLFSSLFFLRHPFRKKNSYRYGIDLTLFLGGFFGVVLSLGLSVENGVNHTSISRTLLFTIFPSLSILFLCILYYINSRYCHLGELTLRSRVSGLPVSLFMVDHMRIWAGSAVLSIALSLLFYYPLYKINISSFKEEGEVKGKVVSMEITYFIKKRSALSGTSGGSRVRPASSDNKSYWLYTPQEKKEHKPPAGNLGIFKTGVTFKTEQGVDLSLEIPVEYFANLFPGDYIILPRLRGLLGFGFINSGYLRIDKGGVIAPAGRVVEQIFLPDNTNWLYFINLLFSLAIMGSWGVIVYGIRKQAVDA